MTLPGSWSFSGFGYIAAVTTKPEGLVMRFASLPGCKLTNAGALLLVGLWSNGTNTPTLLKSGFHAHGKTPVLTWANDGGSCALAGKAETVAWESFNGLPESTGAGVSACHRTTPIIAGNNK